jgi:hypothetical protein
MRLICIQIELRKKSTNLFVKLKARDDSQGYLHPFGSMITDLCGYEAETSGGGGRRRR